MKNKALRKILILFRSLPYTRKTTQDHLFSFQSYVDDVEFFYCDFSLKVPSFLKWIQWDGIILHYTLLSERWDKSLWSFHLKYISEIKELQGVKIAIPQDEYAEIAELQKLIKNCDISTVFTCLSPHDYDKIYPLDKTGLKYRLTTFTGFVDETSLSIIHSLKKEITKRNIDIGYRARNVPFWLGKHGQIKTEITDTIKRSSLQHHLKLDISNDFNDVFYGNDWLRFLLRCRCAFGCLGGASLYDPDGTIRQKVEGYCGKNKDASFAEVEKECFPGKDYSLSLFALSPRHFECAMTKTCQILVEGDYQGVLIPGKHFIELKKDFSNLEEVFEKAGDLSYCEQIAENAYRDIVQSRQYTYRTFAYRIVDHIKEIGEPSTNSQLKLFLCRTFLKFHVYNAPIRYFLFRVWRKFHTVIKPKMQKILRSLGFNRF